MLRPRPSTAPLAAAVDMERTPGDGFLGSAHTSPAARTAVADARRTAPARARRGRRGAHGPPVGDGVATGGTEEATDDATMQTALGGLSNTYPSRTCYSAVVRPATG